MYGVHPHRLRSPFMPWANHLDQPFTFPILAIHKLYFSRSGPTSHRSNISNEMIPWSTLTSLGSMDGHGRDPKRSIIVWPTLAGCWGHLTNLTGTDDLYGYGVRTSGRSPRLQLRTDTDTPWIWHLPDVEDTWQMLTVPVCTVVGSELRVVQLRTNTGAYSPWIERSIFPTL